MATVGQTITPQVPGILANGAPVSPRVIDADMWNSLLAASTDLESRIGSLEAIAPPENSELSKLAQHANTLADRLSWLEQESIPRDEANEKLTKCQEEQRKLEDWANKLKARMAALEVGESETGPLLTDDLMQRSSALQAMDMEARNIIQRMEELRRPSRDEAVKALGEPPEATREFTFGTPLQGAVSAQQHEAVKQEVEHLRSQCQALQMQCEALSTNRSNQRLEEEYQSLKARYERLENEANNRVSRAEYDNLQQTCQALRNEYNEAMKNGKSQLMEKEYYNMKLDYEKLKNETSNKVSGVEYEDLQKKCQALQMDYEALKNGRNQQQEDAYQNMRIEYERLQIEDAGKVPRAEYDRLKLQLQDSVPMEKYNALVAQSSLLIEPKIFDGLKKELETARAEIETCVQKERDTLKRKLEQLLEERDTLKRKLEQSASECEGLQAKVLGQVDPKELETLKRNLLALNTVQRTQEEQLRTSVTFAEYDALKQESKNQLAMYTQALQDNAALKDDLQKSMERTEALRKKYEETPEDISMSPSQPQLLPASRNAQGLQMKPAQVLGSAPLNASPQLNVRTPSLQQSLSPMKTISEKGASHSNLTMYGSTSSPTGTYSGPGSLKVAISGAAQPSTITSMGTVSTTTAYWKGDAVKGLSSLVTDKLAASYGPSKNLSTKSMSPSPHSHQVSAPPMRTAPGIQPANHQKAFRPVLSSGPSRRIPN